MSHRFPASPALLALLPALLALLIVASFSSCDSKREPAPETVSQPAVGSPPRAPAPNDAPTIITPWITEHGQITFDSSDDPSQGSGLRLTLLQDGTARVDYLGNDAATSTGTYRIENHSRLQLDFGLDDPWPSMELSNVDGSLVVNAPDKEQIIQIAVAAGLQREDITEEDVRAAFQGWPLRQSIGEKSSADEAPSSQ